MSLRTKTHVDARSEEPDEESKLEEVEEGNANSIKDNLEAVDERIKDPVGEPMCGLAANFGGCVASRLRSSDQQRPRASF